MKKKNFTSYKSIDDFAINCLGLSNIEMALVKEKKRIIEILKQRRVRKKITQASLAEIIGSKQSAIARMESGQVSEVSMDFLTKVAIALGVSFNVKAKLTA